MKIGFFTDTYFPQVSGVATSIKTLKEELEKRGHDVFIFTTSDPKADEAELGIIRMPSIPFISFKDRRVVVSGMIDAYEKAKKYHLDIIHTHTEFGTGWLGKYIAKRLKIPVVHTYHTMYEDYLHYIAHGKLIRPYHVKQASRAFCRNASGIVCPSERVVTKLEQYNVQAPLSIIPTGVNLSQFEESATQDNQISIREEHGLSQEDVILLSLSRLSYEKNIHTLIKGLPEIVAAIPQAKLLIVGNGPYLPELEALRATLNLTEAIIFVGEVNHDQVGRYYRQADYFVNASDSESQGLTYIEALAASTKLVVKHNDYLAQLIVDPSLGKTFTEDEDFASAFIEYYQSQPVDNPVLRQEKLYEISSENFGAKIERFYEEAQSYFETHVRDVIEESLEDKQNDEKLLLPLKLFKKKD
ncbi:glycosyltransferase family 4 protein [Vagococcus salmoninarum]|uniref:1,2-diacylglycerol 3-glucosyltransferase n=1 Tax=Vagococcus salmoninarum TaxID=2739 RepID=A0A429ZLE1_9ENTE|nr:glycosyltransferase family 4 protein [Vagococcus salmoninarum]RST94520.1 1,2-diacylglycerol 3-glucosyltransferase [Vagococcus salmoninarum]